MDFSQPWVAGVARAIIGALILGVLTFLRNWDPDLTTSMNNAIKDGLIVGFGYLALRGGFEGGIDQARAMAGKINDADVPTVIARNRGKLTELRAATGTH